MSNNITMYENMYLLPGMPYDSSESQYQAIDREAVNAFLTRVCGMIGVDPSEAMAQNFRYYSDMVTWLMNTYGDRVIDLYEEKLKTLLGSLKERSQGREICLAFYDRYFNSEMNPGKPRDPDRDEMKAIREKIWDILSEMIYQLTWWDSSICWILDVSDGSVSVKIRNIPFPEEVEKELTRFFYVGDEPPFDCGDW